MALTTIQAGPRFGPDLGRIAAFCRANGIRKLSLFGSALTDRFRDDSDIDLLIEFEPDQRPRGDVSRANVSRLRSARRTLSWRFAPR
jgi:predicted nucleotidyltransferase